MNIPAHDKCQVLILFFCLKLNKTALHGFHSWKIRKMYLCSWSSFYFYSFFILYIYIFGLYLAFWYLSIGLLLYIYIFLPFFRFLSFAVLLYTVCFFFNSKISSYNCEEIALDPIKRDNRIKSREVIYLSTNLIENKYVKLCYLSLTTISLSLSLFLRLNDS